MEHQKFVANSMYEALRQVKDKFGSDAMIISSKVIKQPGMGMLGKDMVEVIASGYQDYDAPKPSSSNKTGASIGSLNSKLSAELFEVKDKLSELDSRIGQDDSSKSELQHMRQEISELKGVIKNLLHQKNVFFDKDWHQNLVSLYQKLTINGLEERYSQKLIEEISEKVSATNLEDYEYLKLFAAGIFIESTEVADLFETQEKGVLALVGTTGVGKTTTLAKIVSHYKIQNPKKKIAILTLDNYRIGAVEQLKEYAKIIKAPFKSLSHESELPGLLHQFRDYDWVFIDTPGRSQREIAKLDAMLAEFNKIDHLHCLLVLNASTRDSELNEITTRFKKFPLTGTIFTKLDEASSYGAVLNQMIRFHLPLYFLSTGQNVPDDIEVASFERIIDLVLNMAEVDKITDLDQATIAV